MKKLLILLLSVGCIYTTFSQFITTWQTTTNNETITIPTHPDSVNNYTVDWGDGTADTNQTGDATHSYATANLYTVTITGDFSQIYFYNSEDKLKITTIEQWGDQQWTSMFYDFYNCENLRANFSDAPDLSNTTSMSGMFRSTSIFNGDLNDWDNSNIINMNSVFASATSFNGNISNWNTSNVIDMRSMFRGATSFNGNISNWNTSMVTDMSNMFNNAEAFNQDIGNWNTSNVTEVDNLFSNTEVFNQDITT